MSAHSQLKLTPARRDPMPLGSGNGPVDPGMEARVTRLEEDFRLMRADVSATRADTSYIRGRLESLPTTWQMVGTVMAANVGLATALLAAVRLMTHP